MYSGCLNTVYPARFCMDSSLKLAATQGGQKKRYKDKIQTIMKKCSIVPMELETNASDRKQWRALCREGCSHLEEARNLAREERRQRRHNQNEALPANPNLACQLCGKVCGSRIGLHSHTRWHERQFIGVPGVVICQDGLP